MDRMWIGDRVIHSIYQWNDRAFHFIHTVSVSDYEGDMKYEWPE